MTDIRGINEELVQGLCDDIESTALGVSRALGCFTGYFLGEAANGDAIAVEADVTVDGEMVFTGFPYYCHERENERVSEVAVRGATVYNGDEEWELDAEELTRLERCVTQRLCA